MQNLTTSTTDTLLNAVTGSAQDVIELGHPHFTGMPQLAEPPRLPDDADPPPRRHGARRRRLGGQRDHRHRRPRRHPRRRARPRQRTTACCTAASTRRTPSRGGRSPSHGIDTLGRSLPGRAARRRRAPRASTRSTPGTASPPTTSRPPPTRAGVEPAGGRRGADRHRLVAALATTPPRFLGQTTASPAPTEAARWLAVGRASRVAGAETIAFEQIQPGAGPHVLPVHRVLLVEAGINIIEHAAPGAPRRDGADRVPLRARAAAHRRRHRLPVRPLALVSAMSATIEPHRRPAGRASPRPAATTGCPRDVRDDVAAASSTCSAIALAAPTQPPRRPPVDRASSTAWGGHAAGQRVGSDARLPAAAAALINGTLAHALDFDDTHLPSVLHPSASRRPGRARGRRGRRRQRRAARRRDRRRRSRSPTGSAWPLRPGAAQLDLLREGLARHLDLRHGRRGRGRGAALRPGRRRRRPRHGHRGLHGRRGHRGQPHRRHRQADPLRLGRPRRRAAGAMAREGVTGPPTVLEGRFGFFNAFCGDRDDADARASTASASAGSCCARVYKPYPSNHFTHPGIDAALRAARPRPASRRTSWRSSSACATPVPHHRRAARGEDPPAVAVPREVLRAVHRRGGAARRRRPRRVPRRLHRRRGTDPARLALAGRCAASPTSARRDLPARVRRRAARQHHGTAAGTRTGSTPTAAGREPAERRRAGRQVPPQRWRP